jgi:hypothetical protein
VCGCQGFHWNSKFLGGSRSNHLVGAATTDDKWPLVVGESGVPYMLGDLPKM